VLKFWVRRADGVARATSVQNFCRVTVCCRRDIVQFTEKSRPLPKDATLSHYYTQKGNFEP
jgi:hypothetical protein